MWNTNDYQIDIILIRHGRVPGNIEKRYIGSTNQSLTEEGKKELAGNKYPEAELLFTSPLNRCIETGEIIYPDLTANIIDEFHEMDFGSFEGKNHQELDGNPEYQAWINSGGRLPFPGGESMERFILRVTRGVSAMLKTAIEYAEKKQNGSHKITIAAVVHGGTIMAIQTYLGLCDFYDKMYDNGEYRVVSTEVKYDISHDCITMRLHN